jgi:lipopolysaccharide biosynthesis regulator YciM
MRWVRVIVPLLLVAQFHVCFAQGNRPGSDPTVRAVAQALRDGRVTDAEKLLQDAIHELEAADAQSPRLADYLQRLSAVERRLGRSEESNALLERAYEIDRNAYGADDIRLVRDLLNQAAFAQAAGDTHKQEQLLNEALAIVRVNQSKLDAQPYTGIAEGVIGGVVRFDMDAHRWLEADALLPELTRLCGLIQEPYRAGYEPCGRLSEVVTEIRNAEGKTPDVSRLPYEGNAPRELQALDDAARKFAADGLYPSAEEQYNRAIELATKIEASPQNLYEGLVVVEMNSLGQLFEKEGFKDRAEQTYLDALRIQEQKAVAGPGRQAFASVIAPSNLVNLYKAEGRLPDAESVLKRVLNVQEKALEERSRAIVQTLQSLAEIDEEEGKTDEAAYAKAVPLYERILSIQEANLGPNHPDLQFPLAQYANVLEKTPDKAKAAAVRRRIAAITSAAHGNADSAR